jgi:hypothetical protein
MSKQRGCFIMAFIIAYIVGVLIILLEEYFLGAFINFSLLNLYIIIIPLGAVILGGFLGFVLSIGMEKGRVPFGRLFIILAIAAGLLTYPALRYMEYKTTYYEYDYTSDTLTINRKFKGEPIKDLGISFIEYEKQLLEYNKMSLTFKRNTTRNTTINLPKSTILNYLDYFANWILLTLSCYFFFKTFASDKRYCNKCKQFYDEELLFSFAPTSYQDVLNEFSNNMYNIDELKATYSADVKSHRSYYNLYYLNCPECKAGEYQIHHMVTEDNLIVESEKDRKVIPAPYK